MPLELLPMEERDLDVYQDICYAAFKDDLMSVMYPNGYTEAARSFSKKQSVEDWRADPEEHKYMKVIDTDLPDGDPNNKIVGVCHWNFYLHDRTEEELDAERKKHSERPLPPDCNEAFMEDFFGKIAKYRQEIMGGKAYILLNLLATHPDHHRRGVGAMHMRWGQEHADSRGLPCYLEASPTGKPLYVRQGYDAVADLPFDAKAWGHPKDLPHVLMLRPAKEMNGEPGE